jgi:hypothetical protein
MKKGNNGFTVALHVTETGLTLSSRFAGVAIGTFVPNGYPTMTGRRLI